MTAADPRAAARAAIIARYGSEAAALLPCDRERAMRDGTWSLVMSGDPEAGPSLMGWRDGPASTMPPEVRRDVSTAIPRPTSLDVAAAEAAYWTERAELREVLGAPPLPVWVRARRVILEEIIGAPQPPARATAPVLPPPPVASSEPARAADAAHEQGGPPEDGGDQDPVEDAGAVQSGQAKRTRAEKQAAVHALLDDPLTDREIARRVGVSPTTVAAMRRTAT